MALSLCSLHYTRLPVLCLPCFVVTEMVWSMQLRPAHPPSPLAQPLSPARPGALGQHFPKGKGAPPHLATGPGEEGVGGGRVWEERP